MSKLLKIAAIMLVALMVFGIFAGMVNVRKVKAGCYTCRFDCILPNGAPGATEWFGELESGDGVHYYCVGYTQISGCRNFC